MADLLANAKSGIDLASAIAIALPIAISHTVLGYFIYLNAATQDQIRSLAQINTELGDLVAAQRRELWAQQSRLSWVVHGPIQSAIVSASAEINQGPISEGQRESILHRLQDAIAALNRSAHNTIDLSVAISELITVWSRVCQITTHIDPVIVEQVDPSASEFESVVELVREALSNAIRHGLAKKVGISIRQPSTGHIVVCVTNDGQAPNPSATKGLGTELFDQVASNWSLTSENGQTNFTAQMQMLKK